MHPEEIPTDSLHPGQVGYIACNMKESSEGAHPRQPQRTMSKISIAHIGDTLHRVGESVAAMTGFQPAKAMVS